MKLRFRSRFRRMPMVVWASIAVGGMICMGTTGKPAQDPAVKDSSPPEPLPMGEPLTALEEVEDVRTILHGYGETHPLEEAFPESLGGAPPLSILAPPPQELSLPSLAENPDFWTVYRKRCSSSCVEDFLEEFLTVPDAILHCSARSIQQTCRPRPAVVRWVKGEPEPISDRFLEYSRGSMEDGLLATFARNLAAGENRFFAGLAGSEIYTYGFEDGTGELEDELLLRKQRKIVWDAFRKTYVEAYRNKADKTIRDDSLEVRAWMGPDFVVLPPMIAGYVYFRGLEKDFAVGPTRLSLSFEPLREWLSGDDLWGAVDFECKVEGFPVGLVVSVGLHDDELGLDFIGIGTSVGIAKKAVRLQQPRLED